VKERVYSSTPSSLDTLKLDAEHAYAGIHHLHEKMEKAV